MKSPPDPEFRALVQSFMQVCIGRLGVDPEEDRVFFFEVEIGEISGIKTVAPKLLAMGPELAGKFEVIDFDRVGIVDVALFAGSFLVYLNKMRGADLVDGHWRAIMHKFEDKLGFNSHFVRSEDEAHQVH